jgi:predicted transcriptional regulator
MSTNTLHIAVESADEFFEDALADLRALEDGEELTEKYVLSLPDEAALERVLRAKNLELLRTVATEDPESVRELARLVERDVKNVSQALHRLEELGLVDLEQNGRAKRPVVWYDHLEIELSIGDGEPGDTGTAPA